MLTTREIFFKYVLNNKLLWFIAIANAFVYMVRYGCLDWAPTYLRDAQGYDIKQAGWAYFAYEFAAIPGTLICGWLSDKVFHGRRAVPTILFMAIVAVFIFLYWQFSSNYFIVTMSLIAIGFFIYGPVMLIGVQALDLAPKNAAGTAAGLTGFFGYSSENFEQFTNKENMIWQIAPSIKWTIFSGRNLVESKKSAQLQLDEEINSYNQILLTALQEVDNALVTYNKSLLQISALNDAFQQSQLTLDLAIEQYKNGLTSYQTVLSSQISLLNYENSLVEARTASLRYLIELYQALGGGWPVGEF